MPTRETVANIIALLGLVVVAVYTYITYNLLSETRYIDENNARPWMKINDVLVTSIEVGEDHSVIARVRINGTNVGHSPAEQVTLVPRLILPEIGLPDPAFPDPTSIIIDVCKQGLINHVNGIEGGSGPQAVVFPNDTKQIGLGDLDEMLVIFGEDVKAARSNYIRRNKLEELHISSYQSKLLLVGCVTYSSATSFKAYQTSFTFDVWHRPPASKPGTEGEFDLTTKGIIPSTEIILAEARSNEIIR